MGVFRDYNESLERVGAGTAEFVDQSTVGIRNFACGLWNQYPRFITETSFGGTSLIRGAMNHLCTPNVPPPPAIPFSGGQCVGDRYRIDVDLEYIPGGTTTPIPANRNVVAPPGIGGAITSIVTRGDDGGQDFQVDVTYQSGAQMITRTVNLGSGASVVPGSQNYIVTKADGSSDDCGNPPGQYPDVIVNTNDFSGTINIDVLDGESIDVDINYQPGDVHYPMNFSFGGIDVEINFGGIYFNFGGVDSGGNPVPDGNGDRLPFPVPRDNQGGGEYTTPERPPNTEEYDEEVQPELPGVEEEVGVTLEWIILEVTSKPDNAKAQFGNGAPDLFYCGWFEWLVDGNAMPRVPVHFVNNIFRKPPGATGYAYTLYNGFNGQAIQYIKKGG